MSQTNVDLVRRMFDAYLRGDDQALLDFADAEIEIEPSWDSLEPRVRRGRDEFIQFWRDWETHWDEYFIEPRQFLDAGDEVVVVIYERGRGKQSGAAVEDEFAHVWKVQGSKVVRCRVFGTREQALAAAGLRG